MTALDDAERTSPFDRVDLGDGHRNASDLPTPLSSSAVDKARPSTPAWLPSRRFIAAVAAIGGMQLLATMDSTVAIVALPKIQDELGLSDAGRSWVITAYVLTFGGLMLLGGRLGDTIGRKRTFIVGVALFTIASVLCGIAWDQTTLVIARLLQGVGAAIAAPTGLALVATTFPKGPARNAATACPDASARAAGCGPAPASGSSRRSRSPPRCPAGSCTARRCRAPCRRTSGRWRA